MEQLKANEAFCIALIDEINEVRQNPKLYAKKVRSYIPYFKGKVLKIPETTPIMTSEGSKAFEEAARYLEKFNGYLPSLHYHSGLTHAAKDALHEVQKLDDIDELSNVNIDDYISKYGQVIGHFAQSVDFGSSYAELVVINLLVDDGDLNRGNRENILDAKFKLIGVSTGKHQVYHECTIIMYARHFFKLNEEIANLSDENYDDYETEEKIPAKKERRATNQKLNVARRSSIGKFIEYEEYIEEFYAEGFDDQDFELPEGVVKIDRQEKIVTENGVQKKVVKVVKYKDDGTTETEIFKEKI